MLRLCTPPVHHLVLPRLPQELVQSSGMDITLDNVLMILDKHYNNVKALDALNQELFQLWMADKETSQIGVFTYQDTFKSWLLLSPTISLLTMWLS